jgi:hypothetical protein
MSRNWKLVLSALVGIVLPWIPVGFWLPGMFGAAIFFREGIHSDHPNFYLVLAQTINFFFDAGVTYFLLMRFSSRKTDSNLKGEV